MEGYRERIGIRAMARRIWARPGDLVTALVLLLGPWVGFWMVEILNENDVFQDLMAWQVLMNMIWYYLLFFLCRLILGRPRRAAAAAATACFLVGVLNHYILRFRGRILFPADLAGWQTAANVADGFDFAPDRYIQQAAILLVAYLFLVWMCPGRRGRKRLPVAVSGLLLLFTVGYSYAFFYTDMLPNLGIYTQQWVTQANGFVLNFTVAMRYSSVDRPADYSRDGALALMEGYEGGQGAPEQQPVHLVVIMNESFADLTIFEGLEVSEDPTPFYHSLTEDTTKGWMYAPVTGGGTASVEFEYLTGFSTLFQPPHTVAYQLYVEEGMPSLAALARDQGYGTTAFHPYKSSGWNRPIAYANLGFDDQIYDEDVQSPYMIRQYISDQTDYDTVTAVTDRASAQGERAFVFNVTMQNHSGYNQGWNNLERTILLSDALRTADSTAEQYLALMKRSDEALQRLIEHYSQVDEPTMVVFFGDHQPPLKNAFYEALYGKKLSQRTTEEVLQQYAVPFFIWTNYDSPEREDVVLSPNFLGMLTAQMAGLPTTGYMSFLDALYQQLPVITPVGLIAGDGTVYEEKDLPQELARWLWEYETLNYCGMVDLVDEARPWYCLHDGP